MEGESLMQTILFYTACICIGLSLLMRHMRLKAEKLEKPFLDRERKKVEILDIKELSSDTKRIRLGLGNELQNLGLPTGKHIQVFLPNPVACLESGKWNGRPDADKGSNEIFRSYTPVTGNETRGYFDLVVKVYRPGDVVMPDGAKTTWENGGKFGLYLDERKVGDSLEIKGPTGINEYLGCGQFKLPGRTISVTDVGMLAGGTGLTPMLQIVNASLQDANDTTKFTLLYANKTKDDILCQDLLKDAEKRSNGRFKVHYTLDHPPKNWKHEVGFITADMIKKLLPAAADSTVMLMCGPPPMVEFACKKNLVELGFAKESMVTF